MSQSKTRSADFAPAASPADLSSARKKLPLVAAIVRDIVTAKKKLAELTAEREVLDSFRRELTWASRSRRYAVTEEAATTESNLSHAVGELSELGVKLVDDEAGTVEFPTKVNGQAAALGWRLGEESVTYWRLAGDNTHRPIPPEWRANTAPRGRAQP